MERRLAAILAADVVGYTRLMGTDEAGTLQRLTKLRQQVLEPLIAEHHGRVVKLMGDGLLVEFASVVDAVTCAVAWQFCVTDRESEPDEDKRLKFRIGINLGDVIVVGDDIHGDGVNIAARLEGMAEPGGICLSDDAYRQAKGKVEVAFEDLGEQVLKNVVEPVRVYRIAGDSYGTGAASPTKRSLALPDKPSIAVLPFTNMSGDPQQEYFSDGLTEDIITGLSKNSDLMIIARNSTFAYKGGNTMVRDVARDLNARYVLEGSVRKFRRRVRITAQLIEAATEGHLWAERYDRDLDDIFAVQDEVVGAIVNALGATDGAIERSARKIASQSGSTNFTAYDCYLQGREQFYRHGDTGFDNAEAFYEKAIALDPKFARAYSTLAWLHFLRFKMHQTITLEEMLPRALELSLQSARLDPADYRAHWVLAELYLYQRKHAQCLSEYNRAIRINPNEANLLARFSESLTYCGRMEEAVEISQQGIRLNPNCPDWHWWTLGFAYFHIGRYEEALDALEGMAAPEHPRRLLAATYAMLGRMDEARAEAKEFLRVVPKFSIAQWASTEPYTEPNELKRYVEGLRKAGLPE
jgi:adenylate cyclase